MGTDTKRAFPKKSSELCQSHILSKLTNETGAVYIKIEISGSLDLLKSLTGLDRQK